MFQGIELTEKEQKEVEEAKPEDRLALLAWIRMQKNSPVKGSIMDKMKIKKGFFLGFKTAALVKDYL